MAASLTFDERVAGALYEPAAENRSRDRLAEWAIEDLVALAPWQVAGIVAADGGDFVDRLRKQFASSP